MNDYKLANSRPAISFFFSSPDSLTIYQLKSTIKSRLDYQAKKPCGFNMLFDLMASRRVTVYRLRRKNMFNKPIMGLLDCGTI